jgi:hypothetical protein
MQKHLKAMLSKAPKGSIRAFVVQEAIDHEDENFFRDLAQYGAIS